MFIARPAAQIVRIRFNQPGHPCPANNPVIKRFAKKVRENSNDIAAQHGGISKTTTNPTGPPADQSIFSSSKRRYQQRSIGPLVLVLLAAFHLRRQVVR